MKPHGNHDRVGEYPDRGGSDFHFQTERQSDVTACRQRAQTSGLRFERSFDSRHGVGRQLIIRDLLSLGGFLWAA